MTVVETAQIASNPRRAPIAKGWPLLGIAWHMRGDPLGTMTRLMSEDAMYLKLGPYRATLFRNPEHIKRIFVDNAANYTKQTRGYEKSKLVLGEGLVTSEGELWQRQRRIANPAFHRQRIAGFARTMVEETERMIDGWGLSSNAHLAPPLAASSAATPTQEPAASDGAKRGSPGSEIDIFRELMTSTLHIAVQTLLGMEESSELDQVSAAVTEVLERTNDIITNPVSLPAWVPLPKNFRFRKAIGTLDRFVYQAIAKRRAASPLPGNPVEGGGEGSSNLLSMLLEARDDQTGETMSDKQLRDEAVTILIAGHETTANALTWAAYLLSRHPDVQAKLNEEVTRLLGNRAPGYEDWQNLKYTRAVVDEAMRLYPPAWMIGRKCMKDDVIGPYSVKGGEFVLVSPYMTHRNPKLWDHPDSFDPDRFLDGRSDGLPKFSYLPFGGGMRFCIGANFALMQATLMLARMAQRCEFSFVEDQKVVPYAMITLRPRYGIRLGVQRRPAIQ